MSAEPADGTEVVLVVEYAEKPSVGVDDRKIILFCNKLFRERAAYLTGADDYIFIWRTYSGFFMSLAKKKPSPSSSPGRT